MQAYAIIFVIFLIFLLQKEVVKEGNQEIK